MVFVPKRITLITRHVDFSIKAKEALEREGSFTVNAFVSAHNALVFLQNTPQDVVIVDFTIRDLAGGKFILQIRAQQPDIGILVSPNHPTVQEVVKSLNIQGLIDLPLPTRQLIKILNDTYQTMYHAQEDTNTLPRIGIDSDTKSGAQDLVFDSINLDDTNKTKILVDQQQSEEIFRKLAAEEPPMPNFEESATVRDLISNMVLTLELNHTMENILQNDQDPAEELIVPNEESHNILAAQILETAIDSSTPVNSVVNKVKERMTDSSLPHTDRWVREPDFLPEGLLPLDNDPLEYTTPTTVIHEAQILQGDVGNLDTDRIVPITRSRPVVEGDFPTIADLDAPSESAVPAPEPLDDRDALPLHPDILAEIIEGDTDAVETIVNREDPRIAQLALALTEMSLETTADALILSQHTEFIAYSGRIPLAELEDFKPLFVDAWTSDEQQTRIRFINLPSSGADYLLYSIRSENDFTLSMLFAGMMPITAIRRQGKRLIEALATVPEPEPIVIEAPLEPIIAPAPPPEEPRESDVLEEEKAPYESETIIPITEEELVNLKLTPYSFVWLLRDTDLELSSQIAQSLVMGLDMQLTRAGWKIYNMDVYEDFVYLRTDAPQGQPASKYIRDLMRVSADLVHGENPTIDTNNIWDDSYLVIPSDRELNLEEIQNFINFARS